MNFPIRPRCLYYFFYVKDCNCLSWFQEVGCKQVAERENIVLLSEVLVMCCGRLSASGSICCTMGTCFVLMMRHKQ